MDKYFVRDFFIFLTYVFAVWWGRYIEREYDFPKLLNSGEKCSNVIPDMDYTSEVISEMSETVENTFVPLLTVGNTIREDMEEGEKHLNRAWEIFGAVRKVKKENPAIGPTATLATLANHPLIARRVRELVPGLVPGLQRSDINRALRKLEKVSQMSDDSCQYSKDGTCDEFPWTQYCSLGTDKYDCE